MEVDTRKSIYRVYISDALKAMGNLNLRYYDLISTDHTVETRTPQEIIDRISNKLNAVGGKQE